MSILDRLNAELEFAQGVDDNPNRTRTAIDGDTVIDADSDRNIRIAGANTPETPKVINGQMQLGEPGAQQATTILQRLLDESEQYQLQKNGERSYNRDVGDYVDPATGQRISNELIERGAANPTRFSGDDQFRAERVALMRDAGIGSDLDDPAALADFNLMKAARADTSITKNNLYSRPAYRTGDNAFTASVKRGTDNMQAMLYASVNAIGEITGMDFMAEWGEEGVRANFLEAAMNPARVEKFDDIDSLSKLGTYVIEAIGENVPNMALMATGAGAAAVGARAAVGKAVLKQYADKQAKKQLGRISSKFSANRVVGDAGIKRLATSKADDATAAFVAKGGVSRVLSSKHVARNAGRAGTFATAYAMGVGEVQNELKEGNIDSPGTALLAGVPIAGLDALGFDVMVGQIFKTTAVETAKDLVTQVAKAAGISGLSEMPTEVAQELIVMSARAYHDPTFKIEDNLDRLKEAAIKGGIAGAAFGGGGRAVTGSTEYVFGKTRTTEEDEGGDPISTGEGVTAPEADSTIQAQVDSLASGADANRSAVFSETGFVDIDLPEGYIKFPAEGGGEFVAHIDNLRKVLTADQAGKRNEILGMIADKPEQSDGTVIVTKAPDGTPIKETVVNQGTEEFDKTLEREREVAATIGGEVEVRTAAQVLDERAARVEAEGGQGSDAETLSRIVDKSTGEVTPMDVATLAQEASQAPGFESITDENAQGVLGAVNPVEGELSPEKKAEAGMYTAEEFAEVAPTIPEGRKVAEGLQEANRVVKQLAKLFGVEAPTVYVHTKNRAAGFANSAGGKYLSLSTDQLKDLTLRGDKDLADLAAAYSVIYHEFGHTMQHTVLRAAPREQIIAIFDTYLEWLRGQSGNKVLAAELDRLSNETKHLFVMKLLASDPEATITRAPQYALKINEWWAEQVVKYITNKQVEGSAEFQTIVQKVADALMKAYRLLQARFKANNMPEQTVQEFLDAHFAAVKQRGETAAAAQPASKTEKPVDPTSPPWDVDGPAPAKPKASPKAKPKASPKAKPKTEKPVDPTSPPWDIDEPTPAKSTSTGFRGTKGGFSNAGKGTPRGDGKDKAMREVADSAIVELQGKGMSSSRTSLNELGAPKQDDAVVMLARNGSLRGSPLRQETMDSIDAAAQTPGFDQFVVGDMPGVDSPFVEYLVSKGYPFELYHAGAAPRFQPAQQKPAASPKTQPAAKPAPKAKDQTAPKAKDQTAPKAVAPELPPADPINAEQAADLEASINRDGETATDYDVDAETETAQSFMQGMAIDELMSNAAYEIEGSPNGKGLSKVKADLMAKLIGHGARVEVIPATDLRGTRYKVVVPERPADALTGEGAESSEAVARMAYKAIADGETDGRARFTIVQENGRTFKVSPYTLAKVGQLINEGNNQYVNPKTNDKQMSSRTENLIEGMAYFILRGFQFDTAVARTKGGYKTFDLSKGNLPNDFPIFMTKEGDVTATWGDLTSAPKKVAAAAAQRYDLLAEMDIILKAMMEEMDVAARQKFFDELIEIKAGAMMELKNIAVKAANEAAADGKPVLHSDVFKALTSGITGGKLFGVFRKAAAQPKRVLESRRISTEDVTFTPQDFGPATAETRGKTIAERERFNTNPVTPVGKDPKRQRPKFTKTKLRNENNAGDTATYGEPTRNTDYDSLDLPEPVTKMGRQAGAFIKSAIVEGDMPRAQRPQSDSVTTRRAKSMIRQGHKTGKLLQVIHEKALQSADAYLRMVGLGSIADSFHHRPGTNKTGETFFEEERREHAVFRKQIADVVGMLPNKRELGIFKELDHNSAEYKSLMNGLLSQKTEAQFRAEGNQAGVKVRQLFDGLFKYLREMGVPVDYRSGYYPMVADTQRWIDNKTAIVRIFQQHGMTRERAELTHDTIVKADGVAIEAIRNNDEILGPSFGPMNAREITPELYRDLQEFMLNDLQAVLTYYSHAAVKRATTQRRWGFTKEEMDAGTPEYLEVKEVLGATDAKSPLAKLRYELAMKQRSGAISQGVYNRVWNKVIKAYFGQLGVGSDPRWRRVNAVMVLYQNVRLLWMATFSSFVDAGQVLWRSGDIKSYGRSLKLMFDGKSRKELEAFAKLVGVIQDDVTDHVMNDQLSNQFLGPDLKKWNERFFRIIGLQQWTNANRVMAVAVGRDFLRRHADGALRKNKDSIRYLKELGVKPERVKQWFAQEMPTDRAWADVISGLNTFVDESIVRPDATIRPVWGSDPNLMMFFHLKSFMWGYHEQILRRWWAETGHKPGAMKVMPALALFVTTIPLAAAGYEARRRISWWGEPPEHTNKEGIEYFFELAQRSGYLGVWQLAADADQAEDFGKLSVLSIAGPTLDQFGDFLQKDFDYFLLRSIPPISQSSALRTWISEQY